MKYWTLVFILIISFFSSALIAQQKVDHARMNYLFNPKANSIIYNDTLYKGSNEYKYLFYKTGDQKLVALYQKHQSNKIWGNVFGFLGTFATGLGVAYATNNTANNSAGWIVAGSGIFYSVLGGYLLQSGQKNLIQAVNLFNSKYNHTSAGIGLSGNSAGLVINF